MFPKSQARNPRELWVCLRRILSKSKVWSDRIQVDRLSNQFQEWKALYSKPCLFRKSTLHWCVKKTNSKFFLLRLNDGAPTKQEILESCHPTHLLGAGAAHGAASLEDTSPGKSQQSCVNSHFKQRQPFHSVYVSWNSPYHLRQFFQTDTRLLLLSKTIKSNQAQNEL